ncbi:hypothetical protein NTH35_002089 [Vibrio fluvialis]|nr:hypothetical protein [Vibrio fluvialis]MBY8048364.1 hypothetical protein [Vibrio fluvialis]
MSGMEMMMSLITIMAVSANILLFESKPGNKLAGDFEREKLDQDSVIAQVQGLIDSKLENYLEGEAECGFRVNVSESGLVKVVELRKDSRRNSCMKAFKSIQNQQIVNPLGKKYHGLILVKEDAKK